MSDDDPDPYGPTGSKTRAYRKDARRHTWLVRDTQTESAHNARVEFARARAERGEGRDIVLPPMKKRTTLATSRTQRRRMSK